MLWFRIYNEIIFSRNRWLDNNINSFRRFVCILLFRSQSDNLIGNSGDGDSNQLLWTLRHFSADWVMKIIWLTGKMANSCWENGVRSCSSSVIHFRNQVKPFKFIDYIFEGYYSFHPITRLIAIEWYKYWLLFESAFHRL